MVHLHFHVGFRFNGVKVNGIKTSNKLRRMLSDSDTITFKSYESPVLWFGLD
jgi:hypothetical protein